MSQYERLMIAAPLEPVEAGQSFESLPPHVTILPWYDLATDQWEGFDTDLREGLEEHQLSSMRSLGQELFGPKHDIEVTVVGGIMFGVHALVHELVHARGGHFDETYTGLWWKPHISDVDVPIGEHIDVAGLAVFRKNADARKEVKAVYGASNEAAA